MEETLLLEFIKSIQGLIPSDMVRATPKGLFIPKTSVPSVIEAFHGWLDKKGMPNSSDLKSKKRLFGVEEPPSLLLKEGKLTLTGTLLACKIDQPQQLGFKYFLGSLDDARAIVTNDNPLLQKLSDVVVQQIPSGIRLEVKVKEQTILIAPDIFEYFTKLRGRDLPKAEQINFLVKNLRSARKYKEGSPLLVPFMLRGNKTVSILTDRSLIFVINGRNELSRIYDLHPRNIERFLREDYEEILNRSSQTIGALMVPFRNDNKLIGKIKSRGKDIQISWKGFTSLAAKIAEHPPFEPQFQGRFTLIQCLEKLLQQLGGRGSVPTKSRKHHGHNQRISN